jgi:alpha-glucosidase
MRSPQTYWHKDAIVYQIYPRSFLDSNGNGIGDLQGIIDKLDYLGGSNNSLGVTAIWLSPIYKSPMADFGYDVANYNDIDSLFGNLDTFRHFLAEAHNRGIKVILDFVPNHSSDQHPWFVESQSSLDNPKRDWYIWQAPKASGSLPNNWQSNFGGSAWELSPITGQYYLHSFLAKQPDLNWDNPDLRSAMKSSMRFWLDIGVDGFRADAVDWLSKDTQFRDDPLAGHKHSRDGPHLFERLNEMTQVLREYNDRFLITEYHPETEDKTQGYLQYYEGVNSQLSAPFNFGGIYTPWIASDFRNFVDSFQASMKKDYTPIYTLGNHDESRVASRIGGAAARTAAMMLLTLPGLPIIYYGDEIGMVDVAVPAARSRDPFIGVGNNRDAERTPMQWDNSRSAGFTTGKPWLPIAKDYKKINVQKQSHDTFSILQLYKQLINFRTKSEILKSGTYIAADFGQNIFGYYRKLRHSTLLVLLNFIAKPQSVSNKNISGIIRLSTYLDIAEVKLPSNLLLRANEGLIIEVTND